MSSSSDDDLRAPPPGGDAEAGHWYHGSCHPKVDYRYVDPARKPGWMVSSPDGTCMFWWQSKMPPDGTWQRDLMDELSKLWGKPSGPAIDAEDKLRKFSGESSPTVPSECREFSDAYKQGFGDSFDDKKFLMTNPELQKIPLMFLRKDCTQSKTTTEQGVVERADCGTRPDDGDFDPRACSYFRATVLTTSSQVTYGEENATPTFAFASKDDPSLSPKELARRRKGLPCCVAGYRDGLQRIYRRMMSDPTWSFCRNDYAVGVQGGKDECHTCVRVPLDNITAFNCYSFGFMKGYSDACPSKLNSFLSYARSSINDLPGKSGLPNDSSGGGGSSAGSASLDQGGNAQ